VPLVIVIVAEPPPPPEQPPVVVMTTGRPESAVAATPNDDPVDADAGAGVVTWIAWLALTIVNVNGCVASGLTPLLAVVVSLR
jgi:hypothetical protein